MSSSAKVRLNLHSPQFQSALFDLQGREQRSILNSLRKLFEMTWEQVYNDRGLHWEVILSKSGPEGGRLYSLHLGRGFRAVAFRDRSFLRLLSLHPDHDSAYE